MHKAKMDNRDEIIQKEVKLSQLKQQNQRLKEESKNLDERNTFLKKENDKYSADIEKLEEDIRQLIRRIDIDVLLKEVDIEELRLQAANNAQMNKAFRTMLNRFESIKGQNDII